MVVHQKLGDPASRIISLGMAKGIVMELMKGKKMNWAIYAKWTNQEQQWWKTPLVELVSQKGNDGIDQPEGDEENLVGSNSCMIVVIPKEVTHYLEFIKKLF